MIKQISLALGILGLSASAAYAGHVEEMLPVAPPVVNVTIPQQVGSWTFGGELIYWEAANGDFHYGSTSVVATNGSSLTNVQRKTHVVNPENDLGFRVNLGYNFEGDGRYVNLEWTHLDAGESSTRHRDGNEYLAGAAVTNTFVTNAPLSGLDVLVPYLPFGLAGNTNGTRGWDELRGSSSNDFDSIDLVFGQRFDFGQKVTLAAFGGLRYADIENRDTLNTIVADTTITAGIGSANGRVHFESEYWGVGPRAGMNAQVRLGAGFSVVGTFAGSLLVGEADQKQTVATNYFTLTSNTLAASEVSELRIQDQTRVVPELDARIGINYSASFNSSSAFGLEVGYHVENYFGVKDNSQDSYFDSMSHNNDFALHGPYVRVQFEVA